MACDAGAGVPEPRGGVRRRGHVETPSPPAEKTIATRAPKSFPLHRRSLTSSSSRRYILQESQGNTPSSLVPSIVSKLGYQDSRMVAPVVIASAGLGMLAGVAMANRSLGDGLPVASRWDARPRCATCGGSGRVECMCNRWSDGDSGCRTCAGSGRMPCRSCGGSGTGRPLPARLIVQNQKPPPVSGRGGSYN